MSGPICLILFVPSVKEPIIDTADMVTLVEKAAMNGRWMLSPFWMRTMDVKSEVTSGATAVAMSYFSGSCFVHMTR